MTRASLDLLIIKKPGDGDLLVEQWMVCSSISITWIFNTLEKDLKVTVAHAEAVKILLGDLRECFSLNLFLA